MADIRVFDQDNSIVFNPFSDPAYMLPAIPEEYGHSSHPLRISIRTMEGSGMLWTNPDEAMVRWMWSKFSATIKEACRKPAGIIFFDLEELEREYSAAQASATVPNTCAEATFAPLQGEAPIKPRRERMQKWNDAIFIQFDENKAPWEHQPPAVLTPTTEPAPTTEPTDDTDDDAIVANDHMPPDASEVMQTLDTLLGEPVRFVERWVHRFGSTAGPRKGMAGLTMTDFWVYGFASEHYRVAFCEGIFAPWADCVAGGGWYCAKDLLDMQSAPGGVDPGFGLLLRHYAGHEAKADLPPPYVATDFKRLLGEPVAFVELWKHTFETSAGPKSGNWVVIAPNTQPVYGFRSEHFQVKYCDGVYAPWDGVGAGWSCPDDVRIANESWSNGKLKTQFELLLAADDVRIANESWSNGDMDEIDLGKLLKQYSAIENPAPLPAENQTNRTVSVWREGGNVCIMTADLDTRIELSIRDLHILNDIQADDAVRALKSKLQQPQEDLQHWRLISLIESFLREEEENKPEDKDDNAQASDQPAAT